MRLAGLAILLPAAPDRHINRVYDLVGSHAITAGQIAEGSSLLYRPASLGSHRAALEESGLLPFQPAMLLSTYSSGAHGFLSRTSSDLGDILGRTPTDPEPVAVRIVEQLTAA